MNVNALLSIEDAISQVRARIVPLGRETVDLAFAHQRYLAEDVVADADVPAFDRSAMDGVALRSSDAVAGAIVVQLGESAAGSPFAGEVTPGHCVRVMTGGVVPRGADAVVPVERIERLAANQYLLKEASRPEQNIARQGSEVKRGELVLRAGVRLNGARVGVLATYGVSRVQVATQPIVALLPTGNEIIPVDAQPVLGQVRDANRHALTGLLLAAGADVRQHPVARDERGALTEAIAAAWEDADVLITSGGVSAGDFDLVPPVLEALGATLHFHKIAIKPGKPLLFATRLRHGRVQYAFGLPGNPVSSYVCCALFAVPAIWALQGANASWQMLTLPSATALPATANRAELLPATLAQVGGETRAQVQALGSSADLTRFAAADWFALRPAHADALDPGGVVTLFALPRP